MLVAFLREERTEVVDSSSWVVLVTCLADFQRDECFSPCAPLIVPVTTSISEGLGSLRTAMWGKKPRKQSRTKTSGHLQDWSQPMSLQPPLCHLRKVVTVGGGCDGWKTELSHLWEKAGGTVRATGESKALGRGGEPGPWRL